MTAPTIAAMIAGGWLWALSQAATATSQPATSQPGGGGLADEIAALSRKVLADPLDGPARERLQALRKQQADLARQAYDALAQGLNAYLTGAPALAAPALAQAAGFGPAVALAADLPKGLPQIIADCRQAAKSAAADRPCPSCGGTGRADCRAERCHGSGQRPCKTCGGSGQVRMNHPLMKTFPSELCGECRGSGSTACPTCRGAGTVECPRCKDKPAAAARPAAPDAAAESAIRAVLQKAILLSNDGIDLTTPGALRPSPGPRK